MKWIGRQSEKMEMQLKWIKFNIYFLDRYIYPFHWHFHVLALFLHIHFIDTSSFHFCDTLYVFQFHRYYLYISISSSKVKIVFPKTCCSSFQRHLKHLILSNFNCQMTRQVLENQYIKHFH